jgi:putative transcriptional regulator
VPNRGFRGRIRLLPLLLALLVPASLHGATPPRPDPTPGHAFLTGQLLVATEAMGDPRFQNTVLVMVRHNAEGAMALVINRPFGEQPLAKLLDAIGEKGDGVTGTVPIHYGGPVEPEKGFVLHSSDYRKPGTLDITGEVSVTVTQEIFRDIAARTGPGKFLIAFGYAGWGAGQLESEIAHGAWYTAPLDLKLVFDADRDKVWELAVARRTRDL